MRHRQKRNPVPEAGAMEEEIRRRLRREKGRLLLFDTLAFMLLTAIILFVI